MSQTFYVRPRASNRFDKLITALKTPVDNDGTLDKEATSYHDILDAFRLALKFYNFEAQQHSVHR
jgi:dihydrodipicolinate synthase/N-acetylneuraminate lyase